MTPYQYVYSSIEARKASIYQQISDLNETRDFYYFNLNQQILACKQQLGLTLWQELQSIVSNQQLSQQQKVTGVIQIGANILKNKIEICVESMLMSYDHPLFGFISYNLDLIICSNQQDLRLDSIYAENLVLAAIYLGDIYLLETCINIGIRFNNSANINIAYQQCLLDQNFKFLADLIAKLNIIPTPSIITLPTPKIQSPERTGEPDFIPAPVNNISLDEEKIPEKPAPVQPQLTERETDIINAIKSLDAIAFNNLYLSTIELTEGSKWSLRDRLLSSNTIDVEINHFITEINIPISICIDIIESIKNSSRIKNLFIRKMLDYDDQEYYKYRTQFNRIIAAHKDINRQIITLVNQKNQTCKALFRAKSPVAEEITSPKPVAPIEKTEKIAEPKVLILAKKKTQSTPSWDKLLAEYQKSKLMLAFEHQEPAAEIISLLKFAHKIILNTDNNQQNILHYWAKYYKPEYLNLIESIWEKFHRASNPNLNLLPDSDKNTFLHLLMHHTNEADVFAALYKLMNLNNNTKIKIQLLQQDKQHKTPAALIDDKTEDWPDVRNLIYASVQQVIFTPGLKLDETTNFYNSKDTATPIYKANNLAECLRLITALEDRYCLRWDIHKEYDSRLKQHLASGKTQTSFEDLYSKVLLHFGNNELMNLKCNGQSMFGQIMDILIKTNDPTLASKVEMPLFTTVKETIPLTESIEWKVVIAYLEKHTNLKDAPDTIKSYLKYIGSRASIKDASHQSAIDYAILTSKLNILEVLCTECDIEITHDNLFSAIIFTTTDNNFSCPEFLLKKAKMPAMRTAIQKYSAELFRHAIFMQMNARRTQWLVDHSFNPEVTFSDGQNALQILLQNCNDDNFKTHFAIATALLSREDSRLAILTNQNLHGKQINKNCLDKVVYLAITKSVNPDNLYKLFKLLFDNGAMVEHLSVTKEMNILHYLLVINNLKILNLCLNYISHRQQMEFLLQSDTKDKTVLDLANTKFAEGKAHKSVHARFMQLESDLLAIYERKSKNYLKLT